MFGRKKRDREEPPLSTLEHGNLGGYYARDTHRGGFGDDYARDHEPATEHLSPPGDPLLPRESDRRAAPSYRGIGPKNFRRSDDRIREEVCERLSEAHGIDATDIDVHVTDGAVLLTGAVLRGREIGIAEEIAHSCGGVREVENRIKVQSFDREVRIGKAME